MKQIFAILALAAGFCGGTSCKKDCLMSPPRIDTVIVRDTITVGINVVMEGPIVYSRTVNTFGEVTSVTYSIPVSITSGNRLYLGQTVELATAISGTNAFALAFQKSSAPTTDEVTSTALLAFSSPDAPIEGNGFRIENDQTRHFKIKVTLLDPTTRPANYRVQLKQLQAFTDPALTSSLIIDLIPETEYRTEYQFINH